MMPNPLPAANRSPRRKRVTSESDCYTPSAPSPFSSVIPLNSLPEAKFREEDDLGGRSPRTAVAGRFGGLAIRGQLYSPELSSDSSVAEQPAAIPAPAPCWSGFQNNNLNMPGTVSDGSGTITSGPPESPTKNQKPSGNGPQTSIPFSMEETKSSSREKRNLPARPKTRKGSPPLTGGADEDPLTWHDSEITGHLLSDPSDDGYGINGIGFKPTAAIAWARSQKRQRQVADWKSRETKEARERRRERRDGVEPDKMRMIRDGGIHKKVKFEV